MTFLRTCIGCGQTDDHPRHDIIVSPDGQFVSWHHDCHARATGDPVSQAVADTGLQGDELRDHIVANNPGASAQTSVED